MKPRFFIFLLIICLLVSFSGKSQSYYTITEYGISFGCSQYFGDLNNNYGFKSINPAYGGYIRYHLNQFIAVKLVSNFTHLGYDDKYNTNPYEKLRNLNFQTDVFETLLQSEFNFFRFTTGDREHRFTPYLTGGVGVFYYNSYTYYKGIQYFLQPLGTEGQNAGYKDRQYSDYSLCFPIGVGAKMWLTGGINISVEVADRLTPGSYLDDISTTYVGIDKFKPGSIASILQDRSGEISGNTPLGRAGKQRGNTSRKDQYIVALFSLSWHLKTYKCPQALLGDQIMVRHGR